MAQRLKDLPAMRETWVRTLGWEDPLEKEMATHSSILAWRISWTEEPHGLQSTGIATFKKIIKCKYNFGRFTLWNRNNTWSYTYINIIILFFISFKDMQISLKATFIYHGSYTLNWASQMAHSQRNCCQHRNTGAVGDSGSILGSGIFPWRGKWQPTPLGNPIDRGAWWTTVHGVTKTWTTEQLRRQQSIHRIR